MTLTTTTRDITVANESLRKDLYFLLILRLFMKLQRMYFGNDMQLHLCSALLASFHYPICLLKIRSYNQSNYNFQDFNNLQMNLFVSKCVLQATQVFIICKHKSSFSGSPRTKLFNSLQGKTLSYNNTVIGDIGPFNLRNIKTF